MIASKHIFSDNREAQAFICGINFASPSDLEVIDVLVGTDENGAMICTVLVNDTVDGMRWLTGDDDTVIDHREHI